MNTNTTINPHGDLIDALQLLEKIKGMDTIKQQKKLMQSVMDAQVLFSKTLTDTLTTMPDGLSPDEMAFARANDTLSAIKAIRERLEIPITKAKEMVIQWQKAQGMDPFGEQR